MGLSTRVARVAAVCVLAASTGCTLITDSFLTNGFSGDQYPIEVELASGAVMVGLRQPGVVDRSAVLDLLSPVTLVDPGAGIAPSVSTADVVVLGARSLAGPPVDENGQPRAKLTGAQLIALHPCEEPTCVVGPATQPLPFEAVIGADVLAGDAVRLRLGDQHVFVLPDIGGADDDRGRACDAVFPSPYRGGGTLVLAGTELPFGGRRVALQACLGADPDPAKPQGERGADALLVLSTGIGITLLGETAYGRYVKAHKTAPSLESLPTATINLPSGAISGHLGSLDALSLVASSSSSPRAPCRQTYGSHLIVQRDCVTEDDCPCENGDTFCAVPAIIELSPPTGLEVLVVNDAEPTLQALRTELRPDQPEVDGILGTNALRTTEIDVDYPHNRVLARCSGVGCVTRPGLAQRSDRDQIQRCVGPPTTGPIF